MSYYEKTPLIFVYGTLREGHGNHELLRRIGARLWGKAALPGYALHTYNGLPFIIDAQECSEVVGEVYEIPTPEGMLNIDRLEGAYCKRLVSVVITEHATNCNKDLDVPYACWTYGAFKGSYLHRKLEQWDSKRVASGDYNDYWPV